MKPFGRGFVAAPLLLTALFSAHAAAQSAGSCPPAYGPVFLPCHVDVAPALIQPSPAFVAPPAPRRYLGEVYLTLSFVIDTNGTVPRSRMLMSRGSVSDYNESLMANVSARLYSPAIRQNKRVPVQITEEFAVIVPPTDLFILENKISSNRDSTKAYTFVGTPVRDSLAEARLTTSDLVSIARSSIQVHLKNPLIFAETPVAKRTICLSLPNNDKLVRLGGSDLAKVSTDSVNVIPVAECLPDLPVLIPFALPFTLIRDRGELSDLTLDKFRVWSADQVYFDLVGVQQRSNTHSSCAARKLNDEWFAYCSITSKMGY